MGVVDDLSYDHQQAIMAMLPQLLIVLVNRLGSDITVPVAEIDGTGKFNLAMAVDPETRSFHFVVRKKGEPA
jgi:hypothetical protein